MQTWIASFVLVLGAAVACTGCGAAEPQPTKAQTTAQTTAGSQSYTGWYMQSAGRGLFQACGQERQLRITDAADLDERARQFGLQPDTPVYVRLQGTQSTSGDALAVSSVEQFGSETPVRDCGMTGVVIPAPAPPGE